MTSNALTEAHGDLLLVRPPVPATFNKAGANYKSEVKHLEYSPRRAYDEWLHICDAIIDCGGDAIFQFEPADEPMLDVPSLHVDPEGVITVAGSSERLAHMDDVLTGRVFTANGPWVLVEGKTLRALLPNMLEHRQRESPYYRNILLEVADAGGYHMQIESNPHRWEGMADIAVLGETLILTYTVPGHYDADVDTKSRRSSREGVDCAADFAGVPDKNRLYLELVYPHFHGDTVHFVARSPERGPTLVHYSGGLWGNGADELIASVGRDKIVAVSKTDAVDNYAGNSRQVRQGVLAPDSVSPKYISDIEDLGLSIHRIELFELFGKAGGGPACASLHLPRSLELPADSPLRYSVRRVEAKARRGRLPEVLTVDPGFFEGKTRG